jgi:cob(I)alamin adenosyltransferase
MNKSKGSPMKIYTKKGDQGQTSLVDGSQTLKSHARLDSYGTVDELNSQMGLLQSMLDSKAELIKEKKLLQELQVWLFQLGSQLACRDQSLASQLPTIGEEQIQRLESQMDEWDKELSPLKNFILPGGDSAASQAHVCRTVCRRAERACVSLQEQEGLQIPAVAFLNRLSDLFFVLARIINKRMDIQDIEWKP